jgi:structural maintenance of chromosome 4
VEATTENPEEAEQAAAPEQDTEPKKEKSKIETNELVEYSPDELQEVNKDILNAEITQLEGELQQGANC